MDFVYAVLLRSSSGTLSGIGAHTFSEPLFAGGPAVIDYDDAWTVVGLRMDETPPVAVVERREFIGRFSWSLRDCRVAAPLTVT